MAAFWMASFGQDGCARAFDRLFDIDGGRFVQALNRTSRLLCVAILIVSSSVACGKNQDAAGPGLERNKDNAGDHSLSGDIEPLPFDSALHVIELDSQTTLRYERSNILEILEKVPKGTVISIPKVYRVSMLDYRTPAGKIERSSTGFIADVKIIKFPDGAAAPFTAGFAEKLNATPGGVFISAGIVSELQGTEGDFPVLRPSAPSDGFNENYEASGRPKFDVSNSVRKRFGERLNKGVDPATQTAAERAKWTKIFAEMKRVANRMAPTPKALIMIDKELAWKRMSDFEATGVIPTSGAWTIAVKATAVKHDFASVPCAETMSEFVREAYQRAGYDVKQDFNEAKKNRLYWDSSAAVVNFSKALYVAGWIPWDTREYRPPTGALMMNGAGETPGHTYISAGDDGRFIVDNGAPQGRDLRASSAKIINMMYSHGVFFLPPGINPRQW